MKFLGTTSKDTINNYIVSDEVKNLFEDYKDIYDQVLIVESYLNHPGISYPSELLICLDKTFLESASNSEIEAIIFHELNHILDYFENADKYPEEEKENEIPESEIRILKNEIDRFRNLGFSEDSIKDYIYRRFSRYKNFDRILNVVNQIEEPRLTSIIDRPKLYPSSVSEITPISIDLAKAWYFFDKDDAKFKENLKKFLDKFSRFLLAILNFCRPDEAEAIKMFLIIIENFLNGEITEESFFDLLKDLIKFLQVYKQIDMHLGYLSEQILNLPTEIEKAKSILEKTAGLPNRSLSVNFPYTKDIYEPSEGPIEEFTRFDYPEYSIGNENVNRKWDKNTQFRSKEWIKEILKIKDKEEDNNNYLDYINSPGIILDNPGHIPYKSSNNFVEFLIDKFGDIREISKFETFGDSGIKKLGDFEKSGIKFEFFELKNSDIYIKAWIDPLLQTTYKLRSNPMTTENPGPEAENPVDQYIARNRLSLEDIKLILKNFLKELEDI